MYARTEKFYYNYFENLHRTVEHGVSQVTNHKTTQSRTLLESVLFFVFRNVGVEINNENELSNWQG